MARTDERDSSFVKIIFVCDFYKKDLNNKGGAENNDSVLISKLEEKGYKVEKHYASSITEDFLQENKDNFFIIGNFISLSEKVKNLFHDKDYVIYEHDHKYLKTRDPSRFVNFLAPEDQLINRDFYKNANCVICLSNSQADSVRNNLKIDNVESIGCSLWSDDKLNYISLISNAKKVKKYCVLNSDNPTKGKRQAIGYCVKNNISYDLISSNNEKEFLNILSSYQTLIFIPTVLESLCRLAVEAKMLNCNLITKSNLLGASSEDWWDLKGQELIDAIKEKQKTSIDMFLKYICKK